MKLQIKRRISVLLAVVMVLAMAVQSFAAPLSYAKPTAPEGGSEKVTGTWSKDEAGNWHFGSKDGAAKDGWYYLNTTNKATDYNWFHFTNGVMNTGWVQDKKDPSVWYYTGVTKDSSEGGLVKGWVTDPRDGRKYYMDPSTGIMCYGWKQLDGVWYYFGEKQYENASHPYGAMYVNESTPDGYYVGSNGAWHQNTSSGGSYTPPTPVTTYTVTFDMQGHGTQINPITGVTSGSKITAPTPPTETGLIFTGWYKEASCTNVWSFDADTVTNNITLYAKWVEGKTIADILGTVSGGFPGKQNAWVADTGNICFKEVWSSDLTFEHNNRGSDLPVSLSVTKDDNNYVYENDFLKITFTMDDGRLISIAFSSVEYADWNGTYKAPEPESKYIADVLKTVDGGFPNQQNAWKTSDGKKCYKDDATSELCFYAGGEGTWSASIFESVSENGENYVYEGYHGNILFTMQNGKLISITFPEAISSTYAGTYSAQTPDVSVTGVSINLTKLNLQEGNTWKLTATIIPDDATNKNVTWSSSNDDVATVSNGIVSAISAGTAVITVTTEDGGKTATCMVNVSTSIDEDDYTLGEKDAWFTKLTTQNEIGKTKISTITFSTELPQGVKEEDGIDLTKNESGKVKGYISGSENNYEIYIVGDYIFGNENCQTMFYGFSNLESIDFGNFDTSNVKNMTGMFYTCSGLYKTLDLSSFDTSKVTTMESMFKNCERLTFLDFSSVDTSGLNNTKNMFSGCSGLTELNLSNFNTSNVTNMVGMFEGCSSLTSLDLSKFDTSKVTNMSSMFKGCSGLEELAIENFETSSATTMSSMFEGCSSLTSLDLSKFVTSKVTDMSSMFKDCSSLTSLDLSKFVTSKVTKMSSMFKGCSGLEELALENFETSSATTMSSMFEGCSSLTSLDLSKFNTSKVTDMSSMFKGCSSLTSLDPSAFYTSNVNSISGMFAGCSRLTELVLSNFDLSKISNKSEIFADCSNLGRVVIEQQDYIEKELEKLGSNWIYENGAYVKDNPAPKTLRTILNKTSNLSTNPEDGWVSQETVKSQDNTDKAVLKSAMPKRSLLKAVSVPSASDSTAEYDEEKVELPIVEESTTAGEKLVTATESYCCYLSDECLIFQNGEDTVSYSLDEELQSDGDNWKLIKDDVTITFVIKQGKLVSIIYSGDERFDATYISPNKQDENVESKTDTGDDNEEGYSAVPYPFNIEEDMELENDRKE